MKPIFREVKETKSNIKAYELSQVEALTEITDGKVINEKANSVMAIGVESDLFVIQQIQLSFGEAQTFKEGYIETLLNIKLYGEIAEYIGEYLNDLMTMEYISDIGAYKGDYFYNGSNVTVYYSGSNKEIVWLSGKPFNANEFKPIEKKDMKALFNFAK